MTENIEKVIGDQLEKNLPEIVDTVTEKKMKDYNEKLEDVKSEIKKFKRSNRASAKDKKAFAQKAMVNIVKEVWNR